MIYMIAYSTLQKWLEELLFNQWCFFCLCILSFAFHAVWYSHWLHENVTPSCLDCWWALRLPCVAASYSHWLHEYTIPSCLDFWWVLRLLCVVAWYSHWLQQYFTPSCLDCWWVLRWLWCFAWYSHLLHKYFTSLCFILLVILEMCLMCCLVFTLVAGIFYTIVDRLLVSFGKFLEGLSSQ